MSGLSIDARAHSGLRPRRLRLLQARRHPHLDALARDDAGVQLAAESPAERWLVASDLRALGDL
jgi:hypothetical protein